MMLSSFINTEKLYLMHRKKDHYIVAQTDQN